jgi:outer membrane protein W
MKKLFLLLVVFSLSIAISAQTKKGNMFLSGGTSLTLNFLNSSKPVNNGISGEATKWNSISFRPSFGYFVANNLSVGLVGYLYYGVTKYDDYKNSSNTILLAPTISFFWPFNPLGGKLRVYSRFGVGINIQTDKDTSPNYLGQLVKSTTSESGPSIDAGSGFSYFVKENISLNMDGGATFNYLKDKDDSKSKTREQKYFYNIGISVFF